MVNLIGYNRIKSKKNEQRYVICHYSYPDRLDFGMGVANAVVKEDVFDIWQKNNSWERVSDGYDREKKSHFLYLK